MRIILLFILLALPLSAERIVSLSPALTELVHQLGQGAQLVGRSEVCDFPPEVKKLPVAGRFADPDLEKLLKLKPTLLITNDLINPGIRKILERSKIRCLQKSCNTVAEYLEWVKLLGETLHCEEAANKETARVNAVVTPPTILPVKVLWVIWDSPLMIAGKGSLADGILASAGAQNIAGAVNQAYFKCSFDWLCEHQPDAIVWTASPRNDLKSHRLWGKLHAVQKDRVIMLPNNDLVQRPGPRICDGIQLVRQKLEAMQP